MPRSESLRSSIESLLSDFATRLEVLVRESALEQVMAALGSGVAASPARRGRPRKAAATGGGRAGRRSSGDVDSMQETLLSFVKTNPGQRADQIAVAIGSDVKTIRLPMQKLLAARQVRTEGQRRGTTYHAGAGGRGRPKGSARNGRRKAGRGGRKGRAKK